MKAEDLMVGDWVRSKIHNVDSKIIDIEGEGYNFVWLESEECWERHYMDEIEPIPLTSEILKKNGLKNSFGEYFFGDHFEEDEHVRLEISSSSIGIFWSINYDEYRIVKLNFVHELQHAMKLCGIEKEIVL